MGHPVYPEPNPTTSLGKVDMIIDGVPRYRWSYTKNTFIDNKKGFDKRKMNGYIIFNLIVNGAWKCIIFLLASS